MELAMLVLAGGGLLTAAVVRLRNHRLDRKVGKEMDASEVVTMRHLAEEDAVLFGEELTRLDARVAGAELDADARVDYQAALDSYEKALRVADRLDSVDQVSEVVDALAAGRYSAACVVARLEGTPVPAFRVPCFFDPRHGPASTEVMWNAPGRGTKKVPACAQDAARRAAGETPDVKMVRINGQEVPYWAAGGLYQPYENGYVPRTVREATLDNRASYDNHFTTPLDGGGFPN